jgi:two-component system, NtrC family, response regulator AtoC
MALGQILVVEDDVQVAQMLHAVVVDSGYYCMCAENGLKALRLVRTYQPDVILLDHYLPGMTGAELLIHLRREHPEIPVVMVTANADQQTALKTLDLGAFDYVRKPFDVDVLERILQAAMVYRAR